MRFALTLLCLTLLAGCSQPTPSPLPIALKPGDLIVMHYGSFSAPLEEIEGEVVEIKGRWILFRDEPNSLPIWVNVDQCNYIAKLSR